MKIKEIHQKISEIKNCDKPLIIYEQLWKLDRNLFDDVISNSKDCTIEAPSKYEYGVDDEKELLLEDKYSDLYLYYVSAYIDYLEQDMESYNNNMVLYNNMLLEFSCEYRRNHQQKNNYQLKF